MGRMGIVLVGLGAVVCVAACHASEDDAEGQARELQDPVRRQNAIGNLQRLYAAALSKGSGDRNHAEVKKVADVIHAELTKAYIDHPEDTQNGLQILELLKEMQDPRTLPALVKALAWRPEVTEEHAIRAAQAISSMQVPENKKGEVVSALAGALEQVSGARGIDNRMRIEFLRALGSLRDKRALPVLTKVALTQTEEQNFLINRMAAQQIGRIASTESIEPMIKALFLFAPTNPAVRMNDVAAEALVGIGRPALAPLLKVMRGEHAEANKTAEQFIQAVKQRDAKAAEGMNAREIVSAEATFALGALGFRDALEPLLAETNVANEHRKTNGVLALVRLQLKPEDLPKVREALTRVYGGLPNTLDGARAKAQLIAAGRYLYDAELIPFFLTQAKDAEAHPDVRIVAVRSAALLANKDEATQLREFMKAEPPSEEGGYRETFLQNEPMLKVADECDKNVSCWVSKLGASDKLVSQKAAYMVGRYGQGNASAVAALVKRLDYPDIDVRLAAIHALDRIATQGNAQAVEKIEEMRTKEEGRAIWTQFSQEALPIQARLRARAG